MDWITVIQNVLATSSIVAIVLVILGFLAKSLFSQILSKDVENYKIKLQSEVEQLKANLEKASIEHQIRFKSLHTKRAEVIAELYSLLVQAINDASSMARPLQLAGEPPQREKHIKANKSGKELNKFFVRHRIYFKSDLCNQIDNFISGLHSALIDFEMVIDAIENDRNHREKLDNWRNTWNTLTKEISPIKAQIEDEFRIILGIEDAS
jgi:hypothetical protein